MTDSSKSDHDAAWLTTLVQHEGYPLSLRVRPKADSPQHRRELTRSLVVTHDLARVKSNGLPESEYNQSLAEFDHAVHEFIESEGSGLVVLVETFAGKRTYYTYVGAAATFKSRFEKLKETYPRNVIHVEYREDPLWETYELYRKLFPW